MFSFISPLDRSSILRAAGLLLLTTWTSSGTAQTIPTVPIPADAALSPTSEVGETTLFAATQFANPTVTELLGWLPEQTETWLVAQNFELTPRSSTPQPQLHDWDVSVMRWTAVGESLNPDDPARELLGIQRPVAVAVHGARQYEVVSAFGMLRSQSASLLRFTEPLTDIKADLAKAWQTRAIRTLNIHGISLYLCPHTASQDAKTEPWQVQGYAMLDDQTLLTGTSDRYLQEVLEPRGQQGIPQFIKEFPHYNLLHNNADAIMLRQVPEHDAFSERIGIQQTLSGIAASYKQGEPQRLILVPLPGGLAQANAVHCSETGFARRDIFQPLQDAPPEVIALQFDATTPAATAAANNTKQAYLLFGLQMPLQLR